jgi:hypothetical protein
MRATYRVTPLLAWVFSLVILAGSGVMLGFVVRDTVRHVTADDQPAVVTDVGGTGSRISNNDRRRARSISFRLEDGTEHAASAEQRWFWWPSPGETVHVHETSPDNWEISEEFSWIGTVGWTAALLLPWVVAALKVWEWAARKRNPERFAQKERASKERVRARLDRSRRRT